MSGDRDSRGTPRPGGVGRHESMMDLLWTALYAWGEAMEVEPVHDVTMAGATSPEPGLPRCSGAAKLSIAAEGASSLTGAAQLCRARFDRRPSGSRVCAAHHRATRTSPATPSWQRHNFAKDAILAKYIFLSRRRLRGSFKFGNITRLRLVIIK